MDRRYHIQTLGCQMNKHDSERIAGLLASEGLQPADAIESADVIVFNTCCVRERAEERFRGQVTSLGSLRKENPDLVIAVGGCIGQKDGAELLAQLPQVDIVFGTHNLHELPDLLAQHSAHGRVASVPTEGTRFAADLPSRRDLAWHAWVPITVGCDNHCSYCIVPRVRGRERSRALEDVTAEVERLVADGVVEVTLLGQNVNSYGRDLYGSPRFADILTAVSQTGVQRVRFTTSHPKDLSGGIISAMASTPAVCRHLHLPLQSGSTNVLHAMKRRYTREHYVDLVRRLKAAMPDLALSTDIMVGFPGETEEDFQETLDVVSLASFEQAFTFIFSPRSGTPAARLPDQIPADVSQDRFERLVALVNDLAHEHNRPYVGTDQRILVEGPSKRDPHMLLGRTGTNKVVHAAFPKGTDPSDLPGTFLDVTIEEAHTWFLMGSVRASQP